MLPVDKISPNDNFVPNVWLITNFGKFVFRNLGCVIFLKMVSVCKARQARQARLLKTVNKHFYNFIGQNQQKRKWDEKPITIKSR